MQLDSLCADLDACKIEYVLNEPMSKHTTFKIGGNADALVKIKDLKELKCVIAIAKQHGVPYFVLGKGSNILVSDKGIDGLVISIDGINDISIKGDTVICGAGAGLRAVCTAAQKNSLTGLEFAYGIPGTVGGALYMNAGAYGGEMSQVVVSATAVDSGGNELVFSREDMKLGYRTSAFKNSGLIIVDVTLKLLYGDAEKIKNDMNDYFARRRDKQPLEFPSAGSTFKRPQGYFAGALIEQNGLKGFSVGGAMVSEKHAGFVINTGNATCDDVLNLIAEIKNRVKNNDGVELEPEVIFVGRK